MGLQPLILQNKSSIRQNFTWPWSYGSWIYNCLCNRCLSPLMLWVQLLLKAMCTTLCDKVCQWLATGGWFSLGPLVSSTNKTEILLIKALNTIDKYQFIDKDIWYVSCPPYIKGLGGWMSWVVWLPNNSCKPICIAITNTMWVRACPWSVVLARYSGFFHH